MLFRSFLVLNIAQLKNYGWCVQKMSIIELPDYSAIKKLASALWQEDSGYHGAAVMVGAGFSRSAATSCDTNKKLPLWYHLSKTLMQDLGATNQTDPLRLAEEYYAYFGKQALHDLIKNEVKDASWSPGELHETLLKLPWAEVLTTNWDTLLERAASNVHDPVYDIVCKQEDLASAHPPRITKLHGTIGVSVDLVFTQEDYRKYPENSAAFVNFTRQVFVENELCLLGFSGDDPNFLQWAGWVRDILATHSRRIYLVGSLDLTPPKRKYLESINISPIDLGSLVTEFDDVDVKHVKATEIFLKALIDLKPVRSWEWSPTQATQTEDYDKTRSDPENVAALLEKKIPILTSDRESYPGWLVCPTGLRLQLNSTLPAEYLIRNNLTHLSFDNKAKLLYEIIWRHIIKFEITPHWLVEELMKICDPLVPCVLSKKQQMEIALHLLKNTRWFSATDDTVISIREKTSEILNKHTKYWPESANELIYHQAILARYQLNYPALESAVDTLNDNDPMWKLRKAFLLGELGRFDEGEVLIISAHKELLSLNRNDRNSIYILSRLAWAHCLVHYTEILKPRQIYGTFPTEYENKFCGPWGHIEHIRDRASEALKKQQEHIGPQPSFVPGRYKNNANKVTFSNIQHPLLIFEGIQNVTAMPVRWEWSNFLADAAAQIAMNDEVDQVRYSLAILSANSDTSDVLQKVYSRIQVAIIPQKEVDLLVTQCEEAIKYWIGKRSSGTQKQQRYSLDRLQIFIEVLARLMIRMPSDKAQDIFRLAMDMGGRKELRHTQLFGSLENLIRYTLESIPKTQQQELLIDALQYPLHNEINEESEWPNPIIQYVTERKTGPSVDRRIEEIINQVIPCENQSSAALLRLLPLLDGGILTAREKNKIAREVWANIQPDYNRLPETGLLCYLLIKLPSPDEEVTIKLVRKYLFGIEDELLFDSVILKDIANAALSEGVKQFPNEEQATKYFTRMVAWRPENTSKDIFGFMDQLELEQRKWIGVVLTQSVVPSLPTAMLTTENFDKLYAFYSDVGSSASLGAFVRFACHNESLNPIIEREIRSCLQSKDYATVSHSSHAIFSWREATDIPAIKKIITRMIYLIESGRSTGLQQLLWTARKIHGEKLLSESEVSVLAESVPQLFEDSAYQNINSNTDAINAPLIRSECVKMARALVETTHPQSPELLGLLDKAKNDTLPEVRFAVFED